MEQLPSHPGVDEGKQIGLVDIAIVLAKHKKLVLGLPILAGIVALAIAFMLPDVYTGTAKILPPQQKESVAAAMLGSIAGAGNSGAAVVQAFGLRNPNDLYASILMSRTIADRMIDRFKLRGESETMTRARTALRRVTKITAGKDGLISIDVEDENPQRAADLANAYVDELDRLMQGLAVTEASQRRLFFEKQLTIARDEIVLAEAALRHAIETKGIAGVDAQTSAVVGTSGQLRGQIAVKEIQLHAMRSFATEHNPDAVRLRQEISSMKAELANLEGGRREAAGRTSPAGLENSRKLREVKFLELTVDLLTKQYEMAKIDEAKDAVLIQVVDKAVALDTKSKPQRALITTFAAIAAGILAILLAFLREMMQKAQRAPNTAPLMETLNRHLRWR